MKLELYFNQKLFKVYKFEILFSFFSKISIVSEEIHKDRVFFPLVNLCNKSMPIGVVQKL
jgi:hypothetical protein